ncbi:MAG TPA: alanine racemase, partial [Acidimicrobiales bacterium]|nr:alanine racemase [Acidimicrobiales bacterium]
WVEVDLGNIRANVEHLRRVVHPASVCAVVKAFGYGHGAVPVSRAALDGGASRLGVALAEEGHELREAGIDVPVLVLSEPPPDAMKMVVEDRLTPTIYTPEGLRALVSAAAAANDPVPVHLKFDTGMHRVGSTSIGALVQLARTVQSAPSLLLEGIFTHFAVADEPANDYTARQLALFDAALRELEAVGERPPVVHAGNSAGGLCHPAARYDMVRSGIAIYGIAPSPEVSAFPDVEALRPALSLKAQVSFVKELDAGERVSYGLRYRLGERSVVATVPLGYADGVPRRLSAVGGEVLIGGRRRPLAGSVTMDQVMVDCGPGSDVRTGDEVVLIGRQGDEEISAWEWAERLGTIAYEVTCAMSARLPRIYV